jgi:hypothetical protein
MRTLCVLLLLVSLAGCESPNPVVTDAAHVDGGVVPTDAGGSADTGLGACEIEGSDYTPRIAMSSTDTWPACISDDATYHPISPDISTLARVQAFEQMFAPMYDVEAPVPGLLAWEIRVPTSDDFLNARTAYQVSEGLDSRVVRRPDVHYDRPPTDPGPAVASCTDDAVVMAYPDYCAGPSQLRPVILDAFNAGITSDPTDPMVVYAARIEAGIEWFLYLSSTKEALSCTDVSVDCDSSVGYYNGSIARDLSFGLARQIAAIEPQTHDRIFDGNLAIRCWRFLDPAATATMAELRDRARAQQDHALQRGMVLLVIRHLDALTTTTGDIQIAHLAWLHTLATFRGFDRMIRERSAPLADAIATQLAPDTATVAGVAVDDLTSMLDAAFPCP